MIFSCSVCECQANTQPKLVVLEVGNGMLAMLLFVDDALHWEEGMGACE